MRYYFAMLEKCIPSVYQMFFLKVKKRKMKEQKKKSKQKSYLSKREIIKIDTPLENTIIILN